MRTIALIFKCVSIQWNLRVLGVRPGESDRRNFKVYQLPPLDVDLGAETHIYDGLLHRHPMAVSIAYNLFFYHYQPQNEYSNCYDDGRWELQLVSSERSPNSTAISKFGSILRIRKSGRRVDGGLTPGRIAHVPASPKPGTSTTLRGLRGRLMRAWAAHRC